MKKNPPELWIRATGLYEPIVDRSIFLKAQELLKEQHVRLSDEQLLKKLREALAANGKLSVSIMAATDGVPSPPLYAYRFGSLRPRGSVKIPRVWSLETPPPDDRRQRR